jgi:hypothetical protein
MASRNLRKPRLLTLKYFILITLLLSAGIVPLLAQTTGYYMELRFIQRLTWRGDEYAMRYEVIIQREERGSYNETLREFTEASFLEVSLHPGKYRFQVIPYDYLNRPVPANQWVNFEVLSGVVSEQLIPGDHEIVVVNPSGTVVNRAEVTLPKSEAEKTVEYVAERETAVERITETEKTVEYIPEHIRQFDIYACLAYVPLLPLYGENQLFGENISPFGMTARFCAVSAKESFLNPGIELTASWRVYSGTGQAVHSTALDFNILAQTRFPGGTTALNFRAGAGLSLLPQTQSASPGQYSFHVNIGASFLWLFMKNFYMEGGAEYSQFFTEDNFGFFRPWIGAGYRF